MKSDIEIWPTADKQYYFACESYSLYENMSSGVQLLFKGIDGILMNSKTSKSEGLM